MTTKDFNTISTDVLIIGGGGAGFRAAISAQETGADVLLASKGPVGRCGATPMAGADYTLDGKSLNDLGFNGDPGDSKEKVFNDIVNQGFYLNNRKLLEHYVENAPGRLKELIDWGLKISDSKERAIYTSGINLMDVLVNKARQMHVNIIDNIMIVDLVKNNDRISGALGLNILSGEYILIKACSVVIATGGWHKAFFPNTGMRDLSGEGIAMALRAGAELGNMEFITFCNDVFYTPQIWMGSIAPYIVGLSCGRELTNGNGEKFLNDYDPVLAGTGDKTEWNKCFVSYASLIEIRAGRCFENGSLHFKRGNISWEKIDSFASGFFPNWKYKALDLKEFGRKLKENEPVEVGPAVEYFDGGIVINDRFETSVEGLYAAGECALGSFGANRVFSAITEIIVQGADAGRYAADYSLKNHPADPDEKQIESQKEKTEIYLKRRKGIAPAGVRRELQKKTHRCLSPVRNKDELRSFLAYLEDMKINVLPEISAQSKSRIYNKEWLDALELENMLLLIEVSIRSALFRTESRGVHFREDYPDTDNDNWLAESRVKYMEGELNISKNPVIVTALDPESGKLPYLDMMKKMMEQHSDIGGTH
ncbi:MAG: FAD-binding protein [bacterium]|nr:FAD-binding protein [bacterium]